MCLLRAWGAAFHWAQSMLSSDAESSAPKHVLHCGKSITPLLAKRNSALFTASSDMPLHHRLLARQNPR